MKKQRTVEWSRSTRRAVSCVDDTFLTERDRSASNGAPRIFKRKVIIGSSGAASLAGTHLR